MAVAGKREVFAEFKEIIERMSVGTDLQTLRFLEAQFDGEG